MKLIFITREGYNLAGARIRCCNFARELRKYDIKSEVFSFSDNFGAKEGDKESRLGLIEKLKLNYKVFKKLIKEKDAILYIQRFNYHSFAPYLAHICNKNRMILDLDDWEIRENPKYYFDFFPSSKAHYFTRQIARRSVVCIAASRFLERFLLENNKKVYYLPSGVDTQQFNPLSNNFNEKEIVFSWIGTFHKKEYIENIKFALDCFSMLRKKYPFIYFDVVGDGIYRDVLMEKIKELKDSNISFRGWIAPDRIPVYLRNIHIGLFPIVSNNKFNNAKSPTKLFEYMAMSKPTVSSNIGETIHIIKDGDNGFLANTRNEFIRKMEDLIKDPVLRKQMGEKARETIEKKYSLEVLGKQLFEILKTI